MSKDPDFSHVSIFTDIHYGLKNNSREHNDSCERFIKWMIEQSEDRNIKTCIFGGDFHHVRSAINISTLNYSVSGLKLLNDYFDHTIFILGNHDLFYRDKYEIHSLPYITQFPKITVVDSMREIGDVAFVPWLVADEWKSVPKLKAPYMFGHFELPRFKMNAMVEMPDHGLLNATHFVNQKQVFSGHFHKRQNSGKIWYIGNAFPHNFADAWDDDRGAMFWKPGETPEFLAWPDAPKYRTLTLSQVVANPTKYIDDKTFAKITIDIDTNYEDVNFIRDLLEHDLNAREIQMITAKVNELDQLDEEDINFESVDTIVISHLQSIESTVMDKNELIRIYQEI
jgi:DNA repair exonuclease SbcCD nuclease subunit